MTTDEPAVPSGHPGHVLALGLVVAATVSVLTVGAGVRFAARSASPERVGHSTNSDLDFPLVEEVAMGLLAAGIGLALVAATVAALRGDRRATLVLTGVLLLAAVGAVPSVLERADRERCVEDTYGGGEVCVSRSWPVAWGLVTTTLPLVLGATCLATGRRFRHAR